MNQGGNYEILILKKKIHRRQRRDRKRFPKWWSENYLGKTSAAPSGWTISHKTSSHLVTFLSSLTVCTVFSFAPLRRKRERKLQKILPELLCKERFCVAFIHSFISFSSGLCWGPKQVHDLEKVIESPSCGAFLIYKMNRIMIAHPMKCWENEIK